MASTEHQTAIAFVTSLLRESPVVTERPWRAFLTGSTSFLRWSTEALSFEGRTAVVLVPPGLAATAPRQLAGLATVTCRSRDELEGLWEAAKEIAASDLLVCELGHSLLPRAIAHGMLQRHRASQATLTTLVGVHADCGAYVVAKRLVEACMAMPIGSRAGKNARDVLEAMATALAGTAKDQGRRGALRYGLTGSPQNITGSAWMRLQAAQDMANVRAVYGAVCSDQVTAETVHEFARLQASQLAGDIKSAERTETSDTPAQRACASAKPRLLLVSNVAAYSGAEQALCSVARVLAERWSVTAVISQRGLFADRLQAAGADVITPGHEIFTGTASNMLAMERILARVGPALVHFNGLVGSPMLAACLRERVPIVQHVRTVHLDGYNEALVAATRIVCASRYIREAVEAFGAPTAKVEMIYDGVDTAHFVPSHLRADEWRQRLGLPECDRLVGVVARFSPDKRQDVVIRALACAKRLAQRNIKLCFVGDSMEAPGLPSVLWSLAEQLGVADSVVMTGFREDMCHFHLACDVSVLLSEREGLGLGIVEAMACGRPVVVARQAGLTEAIEDGISGSFVDPGDYEGLARKLIETGTNPDGIGRRARERVIERFSSTESGSKLSDVLAQCINV